jgi:DNA-binding MarR family transcriptional regulator
MSQLSMESVFYSYVERFRTLLSAETWQRLIMDLSKNDFLALVFLHRCSEARMSDLANYLVVPLNTATGVVARLQRRGLVERHHSADDKRVVVVSLSDRGREQVAQGFREGIRIAGRVLGELSAEQLELLASAVDSIVAILGETEQAPSARAVRRIPID